MLLARRGLKLEFADLGDWGTCELRSEYDPNDGAIRVNARFFKTLRATERTRFAALAIGHELYHHYEHCGWIGVLRNRSERERAADEFARALVA